MHAPRIDNQNLKRLLWPLIALGGILLFNLLFTPGFFQISIKEGHFFGSLIDIGNRAAPVMLLSIGMTLVFATGGVDLSVGAIMAISGAIAATVIRPDYVKGILEYGEMKPLVLVLMIPLFFSLLAGLWNGLLVGYIGIQPIIATLILMVAGRGIAQLVTQGQIVVFIHEPFQYIGSGFLFGLPFPIIIAVMIFAMTHLLTRKTGLGMFIEAIGANLVASRFMGIRERMITVAVYVFSGFCAGVAGLIACADIKAADANNAGLLLEMDAIAAVIIGGTIWGGRFTLVGSVIGTLIIQSLTTTMLTLGVAPEVTPVYKSIVIISVALIQSEKFRQLFTNQFAGKKTPQS